MPGRARSTTLVMLAALIGALLPAAASTAQDSPWPYTAEGHILGSNPTGFSLTDIDYFLLCAGTPTTQGVDGHVFQLPASTPEGAVVTATGQNDLAHDLDLVFYGPGCDYLGDSLTEEANESATAPPGTEAVVVTAFFGVDTSVRLDVEVPEPADPVDTGPCEGATVPEDPEVRERGTYPAVPCDQYFGDQWGFTNTNVGQAWQEEQATGYEIKIAVVDSGFDINHPDFACADWKVEVLPGSDTAENDDDPQDVDGHGTHVAGIAGACTNNNGRGVAGVAPDATIVPVKVYSTEGDLFEVLPGGFDNYMADGIRFAADNGAHVINLSIGPLPPESYVQEFNALTEEAIDYAQSLGVVVVAAAGNFNQPICEYPSGSDGVICVGATDRDGEPTSYTDLPNSTSRELNQTGVMAPGGDGSGRDQIVSTYPDQESGNCDLEAGYRCLAGTSMASPLVAGIAALVYDRLGGERTPENAAAVIDAILSTTRDMGPEGWDPLTGWGEVDALAAVQAIQVPTVIEIVHEGGR